MITIRHPRRAVLFAVGLLVTGAFAVLGSAPALAYTKIYGSGAALQTLLQNSILIPKSGQIGGFVQFDTTTSGGGYKEFGNQGSKAGKLEPKEDGIINPNVDAYVATDSGPTTEELEYAREAATGSKTSTSENEVAVPVAQTPLDLLLSLPAGLTLASTQNVDLTDLLAGQLYAGTVPAAGGYNENTWGALLTDAGLSAGSATTGHFADTGSSGAETGGYTPIQVVVRKEGAGTTVNLKQFLPLVDPADWGSIKVDAVTFNGTNEWPTSAKEIPATTGTANDQAEVTYVDGTPGSVGYATAGDASTNPNLSPSGATFKSTPTTSTDPYEVGKPASASHQILYALLQDNDNGVSGSRTLPIYADPETNGTGTANIYTGSNVEVNGSTAGGAGSWQVPTNANGTFNADGTWSPKISGTVTNTRASDPDIYDDSGDAIAYYPLVAVAFDLSWSNFAAVTQTATGYTSEAQATTKAFLQFATSSAGQNDILGQSFYSPLPSDVGSTSLANIQAVAQSAAGGV
jgi:hypothetical protein